MYKMYVKPILERHSYRMHALYARFIIPQNILIIAYQDKGFNLTTCYNINVAVIMVMIGGYVQPQLQLKVNGITVDHSHLSTLPLSIQILVNSSHIRICTRHMTYFDILRISLHKNVLLLV